MRFKFTKRCKKIFDALDPPLQKRILQKLAYWTRGPNPLRYSEPLEGNFRFLKYRVGDYRIIVWPKPQEGLMIILKVGPRGSVYKHLEKLL